MARLTLKLPKKFAFKTALPVRITDINYGNHLGNDRYLSYIQEARMQYLQALGYADELHVEDVALFVGDSAVMYKHEIFYGQTLEIEVVASDFGRVTFDFYFRLMCLESGKEVASAKTGMVCLDLATRKLMRVPPAFQALTQMS